MRDGLVGNRLRRRPELQQALGGVRRGRRARLAADRLRGERSGREAVRCRDGNGKGPDPGTAPALSVAGARSGHVPLERRLRRRDARRPRGAAGRPGRRGAVRGSDHEPDAVGAVGPEVRSRCGRSGHDGGDSGPGTGHGAARGPGRSTPRRPAAHVQPPDGDVASSGAGVARMRPIAGPGPRRRTPAPHAHPHRCPLRGLSRGGGDQSRRDRSGPQVPRARRRHQLLRALSVPQLPLQDLRRDVPRPVPTRDRRGRGDDLHVAGGAAHSPVPRLWPTGSKASSR